jgi:hypothetical protein
MKFPEWLEPDQLNDPTYEHAGIDDALRHGETIADVADALAEKAERHRARPVQFVPRSK